MNDASIDPRAAELAGFRRAAWGLIVAAVVVHATLICHAEPLQSANDRSRWCTIWSLINRGSYQIDEIRERPRWSTIDLVRVDGRFYSTKPPLMSTWVAGVTWLVCRGTGWTLDSDLQRVNAAVLLLVNAAPFALSLVLLARLLAGCCRSAWAAWFVLTAAAFGTLISPFLSTLNNHTVAAAAVMVSLYSWLHESSAKYRGWRFCLWGLASGWAAAHDLPAAAFAALMFVCAWNRDRRATVCWFLPALLVPVIAFLAMNYVATGSLRPTYADYGGDSYRFVHEGVPSYWAFPLGVDRNLDSPPAYLWHCLLGHHGWFSLTPVFLLVFASSVGAAIRATLNRRVARPSGPARIAGPTSATIGLTIVVLGFYLTRTGNYNYGGVSCALRWMLFLAPLWIVALIPAVERGASSRWFRCVAIAALAVSVYSAWEPAGRAWQQPWLFRWMERAGWIDYREPPPELPRTLYSWIAALPDGAASWVEFERQTPSTETERLRLELVGDERIGSRPCAVVEIIRRRGTNVVSSHRLRIDREAFAAGRPPAACLVWTDPKVTAAEQQADLALYRGLPLMQSYRAGQIRYLKTALRSDALLCQRAAAQVQAGSDRAALVSRSDVWLCDEVPFGAARVEWTISDAETAGTAQQESWQVVDCFPPVAPTSFVTVDELPALRLESR
jgi:hypothetical protein